MATKTKLNPKQELFCKLFASDREFFGNGVQSYIEAYNPDTSKPNWYKTARSCASELLTKPNILKRIDELFEARGLNDQFVDKQLEKLIIQDADYSNKVKAIQEYNKLRQRITNKIDLTYKEAPKPLEEIASVSEDKQSTKAPETPKEG